MKISPRIWSCYAALLVIAACGGTGSAAGGPKPERIDPPQLLSRSPMPQLRIPSSTPGGLSPVKVTIEVLVDSTGRPDMKTFRASGPGAGENRDALRQWIEQSMFSPAHRGAQPVAAVYMTRVEARVTR